jgi:HTH-type transcriptional regulator/antitoxin HigA
MDEQKVSRIASNKQPITAELAIVLEETFGVKAELFLDQQKTYDLAIARLSSRPNHSRALRAALYTSIPIADMIGRGWLSVSDIRDKALEVELLRFFGENRVEDIETLPHAAKKTKVSSEISPKQLAWLYRVKQIASEMHPEKYSQSKFTEAIDRFKDLRNDPMEVRKVPKLLNDAGVRFVVVEGLPGGQIDGVCFWMRDNEPVIGMSIRFDRIDNFWFVLRHECAHVLHGHGKKIAMIDSDLAMSDSAPSAEERIANEEASEFCVPVEQMKSFYLRKKPFFTETDVLSFAKRIKTHPGLVVGQLQRLSNQYDLHRKQLVKIRSILAGSMLMDGWGDVVPVSR